MTSQSAMNKHAVLAQARVFDLHHQATGDAAGVRSGFDGLEERAQDAGGNLAGAGDKAVRLVHGQHHGAEIVGLEHSLARLEALHALAGVVAQPLEPAREIVQILAFGGVDDADALERDVEGFGGFGDPRPVAEEDRRAQPQRIELARRLDHARLGAFREDNPLRMPLEFLDDAANESHGGLVA